jgi:4-hydroxy-tetrahydrodipicolinate synthase
MYQLDTPFVNVIKEAIVLCGRPISTHVLPPASRWTSRARRS